MKREIHKFNKEILVKIFAYLMHYELVRVGLVCKAWHETAQDTSLWAHLYHYYSRHVWRIRYSWEDETYSPKSGKRMIRDKEGEEESSPSPRNRRTKDKEKYKKEKDMEKEKDVEKEKEDEKGKEVDEGPSSPTASARTQADFIAKQKSLKKATKSPRKSRRFSLMSRANSVTFGDASREWSALGGFRQDHSTNIAADEEVQIKIWHDIHVPIRSQRASTTDLVEVVDIRKIWKSPYLKFLVRQGIPDIHRPGVWANMVGVKDVMHSNPDMYQSTLRSMFGMHLPQKFYRVPNFGGPSFDLICDSHTLSPEGNLCAQRILVVLAMEYPDVQFCPTLPDLVQLFLRYLTESEAYVASKLLLNHSVSLTSTSRKSSATQYFAVSFKGTLASCRVFDLLVKQYIPRLHASLKKHELSVGVMLYHKWFNRLFVDVVPMKTVLRIFDSYLLEGQKGIFRIGLSILKHCEEELVKANSSQEFAEVLSSFQYFGFDESIFDDAPSIPLRRAMLGSLYQQSYLKLGQIKEPYSHVYYHPKNLQTSRIIAEDEFEILWTWLPASLRIKDPHLEFTTDEHGVSLHYMLSKIETFEHTLFLIRSSEDRVFGFFTATPWNTGKCLFFGSRECFVFTMRPSLDHFLWTPGHANDRMQYVCNDSISIGAGPPAIVLHDDLTVTSHACPTFQSPQLGLLANFNSLCVEVYSIY